LFYPAGSRIEFGTYAISDSAALSFNIDVK
jgi:hypothetical protein